MKKNLILLLLILPIVVIGIVAQDVSKPAADKTRCEFTAGTRTNAVVFQRWIDDVWHAGNLNLVDDLVGPTYVRHEAKGTRSVTPAEYTDEIVAARKWLPDMRFIIHECTAISDRLWTRWTMVGTDPKTGTKVSRMGMQVYRLASGRLVETWMLVLPTDSSWPEVRDIKKTAPGETEP